MKSHGLHLGSKDTAWEPEGPQILRKREVDTMRQNDEQQVSFCAFHPQQLLSAFYKLGICLCFKTPAMGYSC